LQGGSALHRLLWAIGLPAMLMLGAASADAQTAVAEPVDAAVAPAADTFWTPQRLLNAAPIDPGMPGGFGAAPPAALRAAMVRDEGGSGRPPSVWMAPQPDDLVNAPVDLDSLAPSGEIHGASLGTGIFTESRVIPPNSGQQAAAVEAYPYSAVGKLFFHDPRTGQDLACSGAVDTPRGILTAGHCVAHGSVLASQRYFFSDFVFIPAYDNGVAPYGKWSANYVVVPSDWYLSGRLPNAHDFALIEAGDRGGKTIGSVVGWLGWQTNRLGVDLFTTLGYPCNLDSCVLMQRNDAPTFHYGGNNTWMIGSDMGGGAGGGPWVEDFGLNPKGGPKEPFGGNTVVGVTSYVPPNGVGYIGASQFDQVFLKLRGIFCTHQPGNC
jgi:V8-like Glu-specific endopeptidase